MLMDLRYALGTLGLFERILETRDPLTLTGAEKSILLRDIRRLLVHHGERISASIGDSAGRPSWLEPDRILEIGGVRRELVKLTYCGYPTASGFEWSLTAWIAWNGDDQPLERALREALAGDTTTIRIDQYGDGIIVARLMEAQVSLRGFAVPHALEPTAEYMLPVVRVDLAGSGAPTLVPAPWQSRFCRNAVQS